MGGVAMDAVLAHAGALAALAGVWALAVISPGASVLATAHHAVARSRGHGLATALGVAVGTSVWATLSVLGLGANQRAIIRDPR